MDTTFAYEEWKNRGKTIRASRYCANNSKTCPWILFCHGFFGHRIGPNYLYVSLARYFATEGINSLIFDFSGCGESDGEFSELTISSMCSDVISAYYFLKNKFQPTKICLMGHSFGGTVAALSAHTILVDTLVLLSPLADVEKHTHLHDRIIEKGTNKNGFYEYGPHELNVSFLEEMKTCNPVFTFVQKFKGRMILLQGEKDEQITVDESNLYISAAKNSGITTDYHIVKNADHQFSTLESRRVLKTTITCWIKENQ